MYGLTNNNGIMMYVCIMYYVSITWCTLLHYVSTPI